MSLTVIMRKIRCRETPFYDRLYRLGKRLRCIEFPVIKPFHSFLYAERLFRKALWRGVVQALYCNPLFKSKCAGYGKGIRIYDGIPQIFGNLKVFVGDDVVLHGTSTFVGAKVFESPTLRIGNNTHLGSSLGIVVGQDIIVGNNVLIANFVNIFSYDQHSINPAERHLPPAKESSKPVIIEDNVWIGAKCIILKGVTIGKNSIVASGSVVTKSVPPDSLAAGNPARISPLKY